MITQPITARLLAYARRRQGFTAREAALDLGELLQSVQAAVTKLAAMGEITKTGRFRACDGNRCNVWQTRTQATQRSVDVSYRPVSVYDAIIQLGHDEDYEDRLPHMPTHHLPGSLEKIAIMQRRIDRGESPYHPLDAGGAVIPTNPR